jgi:hypothetical protein
MKTICILNLIALVLVLSCNFEISDLPYFKGLVQDVYSNLLKMIFSKNPELI